METLRNYLNTMFQNLPDTAEVQRARDELWQMMEDKYTDLISEGVSENEAVGTVISEFGNLDDFADLLGIRSLVPYGRPEDQNPSGDPSGEQREEGKRKAKEEAPRYGYSAKPLRFLTVDEVKAYLEDMTKVSFIRAIGVFLCITCVIGLIFFGQIGDHLWILEGLFNIAAWLFFGGFIVVGVLCFIWAGQLDDRWKYIRKENCVLDPEALLFVTDRYNGVQNGVKRFQTIGILLCAFCWLPAAILSGFGISVIEEIVSPTLLFLFVGVGVGILVISSGVEDAHKKLLKRDRKLREEGQILQ